jgi:hypothetical protein
MGEMHPDLPGALLTQEKNKARNRTESRYWDYKQELRLDDAFQVAEFAKDVIAFHNTDGGLIAVGISDQYAANGIPPSMILDTKRLRDKLRKFTGPDVQIFQNAIELSPNRLLWLIFIPKHPGTPVPMQTDGPQRSNRPLFSRGQYFYRDGDEVKLCRSDTDVERVFRGISSARLSAYNYEIDEPFFRLLDPNYEKFVGRQSIIKKIKESLELRQPIIALDGLGGVGKTAIAIEAVRELYQEKRYLFIISVSAKSKVWVGHVRPRQAAFAGLHSLLTEISAVIPYVEKHDDTLQLKKAIIDFMDGQEGLLVVDNLEEIDDDSVLKFLGEEVPAPVKVLITSRIGKDLGARTISIPEMTADEARDLLSSELERVGYQVVEGDAEHVDEILRAAGGVPLAIKWAAQIARERESLKEASSLLRGAGSAKQELLNFSFATMYDALTDNAKDVARLIPYLGAEWKAMTISIALDLAIDAVRAAIFELEDKGIIFRVRNDRPDEYGVLPLTKEFLSNKWHQSHLQKRVDARFSETFSSGSEGFLLEWPTERRVKFLLNLAREKVEGSNESLALKLIGLAQSWLDSIEDQSLGTNLRFLEGKALYSSGKRAAGLTHMRQAIHSHKSRSSLSGDDILFFSAALYAHGGTASEKEASECVQPGIVEGGTLSVDLLSRFITCNIRRGDNKLIAETVARLKDTELICHAFDQISGVLRSPQVRYTYAKEWSTALGRLLESENLSNAQKRRYLDEYGDIRDQLAKLR